MSAANGDALFELYSRLQVPQPTLSMAASGRLQRPRSPRRTTVNLNNSKGSNAMNIKRLLWAFLAVFVFIFAFEWVFHGILLKDAYAQTMSLWRPETEMMGYFHWLVLGQAVIALAFVLLFARGFTGRGVAGGARVGAMVAVFCVGGGLVTSA